MPHLKASLEETRGAALPAGFFTRGLSPRRKLGAVQLVAVIYLVVSGGAYGIEDAVRTAGPRLILLLCVIVPFTLSLPTALMAAELTALIPEEGGFYQWVKQACGPFFGFAEAYCTLLYTAVDMALYPVLFAAYVSFLIHLSSTESALLAIATVWISGLLNACGVRSVGSASVGFTLALSLPFIALVLIGLPRLMHFRLPTQDASSPRELLAALGGGLTVVIWNYCGFENLSIVAAEIKNPTRNYLRAVIIALPLVALGYLLPLMVALSGARGSANWTTGYFAEIGKQFGGRVLGWALAVGGAFSGFALFQAGMLWVSRIPFVLAREGYLPSRLGTLWDFSSTPLSAILLCCAAFTILIPIGFTVLVVIDVTFYMAGLTLELISLVRLRKLRPLRASGLYRIGGGPIGLGLVVAAPLLTWIATFGLAIESADGSLGIIIALVLLLTLVPVYLFCRWVFGGPQPLSAAPI
jgi:amino acid transporter